MLCPVLWISPWGLLLVMAAAEPTTTQQQQNLRRRSLEAVALAVRRDCTVEPERYLEEVYVPFGGE